MKDVNGLRSLAALALVGAGLAVAGVSAGSAGVGAVRAKPACQVELELEGYRYQRVALPKRLVKRRRLLQRTALARCEPAFVCLKGRACVSSAGKVVATLRPRRMRGIRARIALVDSRTGRLFVNSLAPCVRPPLSSRERFLRCLRRARLRPPPRWSDQWPPPAVLLGSGTSLQLGLGSFCWTTLRDHGTASTLCADMVGPEYRHDLPLVVTEPGAVLRIKLGFEPASVSISLGDRSCRMKPSSHLLCQVPSGLPARGFLMLFATRPSPLGGRGRDDASYLARLRAASR